MTVSPGDTEDSSGHTKKEGLAAGGHTPTIPTLGRLKQEDDHHELKASPGHTGPYPTSTMLVEKQYGTGEGRGVKEPPAVGGLALPWRKLSHTVSLASLSSEHTGL